MEREERRTPGTLLQIRLFGVPVRFHFSFLLLLIFLGFVGAESPSGAAAAAYTLALFASVLLHELGHALVSRRCKIKTLEIVLFPIGGVARLERSPRPGEELWIAVAGPAVNVLIAGALVGGAAVWNRSLDFDHIFDRKGGDLLSQIAAGNLALALFNLLPAFPMDGGRILRAMLAMKRSEAQATEMAARAGRALAVIMGLYGLISANFMLVFIAFFVYLGAVQENAAVMGRELTKGVPVRAAMITDFRTLGHGQTIRDAADLLLATSQQDFPIMHGEQVLGLLDRGTLLRAMAQVGPDGYVSGVMNRDYLALEPNMDLAEAMPVILQGGSCVLVMEEGRVVGLLTRDNLTEFLMLRQVGLRTHNG